MKSILQRQHGATLIETAVIIALIAIVCSAAIPAIVPALVKNSLCGDGKVYEALAADPASPRGTYLVTIWMDNAPGGGWGCYIFDQNNPTNSGWIRPGSD